MPVKLTIMGAGPGGYVAAIRAAQKGAQVTVLEDAELGGTCLNVGCIPTKTLVASAETLETVRHAGDYGIEVPGPAGFDLAKVRDRKDKIVGTQVKGIRNLFKSWNISLIAGRGTLLSTDIVRVVQKDGTTMDVKSDRIIIATGSRPAQPAIFPFDGDQVFTSDEAVRFRNVPRSLLIIGAGVIGCEFAFIYRTFGCDVTVVEMMPRAISMEDEEMSEILERELKKAKIKLIPNVRVEGVEKGADGLMVTRLSNGQELRTEKVLVSIGRSLNSENLHLREMGVETGNRGEIVVNERMETSVAGIYAVGDITGKIMLAHVASQQGLVAAENALGGREVMDYSVVPSCIFTAPEIASVGLNEQGAVRKGIAYRVGRFPYRALGKAHAMGAITGMVKVIAEQSTDKVLGVHICGAHATDMIHEGALAVRTGVTAKQLGSMIHAHPTLAEGVREASEDVHGMAIHVPKPFK